VRPVFLIFSLVLLVSCFNQGDCLITSTNLIKISFQKKLDGTTKLTTFLHVQAVTDNVTFDFPTLENTPVQLIALPLDPDNTTTTFVFQTSDSLTYRMTVGYNQYTKIISTDCGAFLFFKDLSVTGTTFDSTKVINRQLLKSVANNLEVYF
jgi:Family of unknown function (DUF6452)